MTTRPQFPTVNPVLYLTPMPSHCDGFVVSTPRSDDALRGTPIGTNPEVPTGTVNVTLTFAVEDTRRDGETPTAFLTRMINNAATVVAAVDVMTRNDRHSPMVLTHAVAINPADVPPAPEPEVRVFSVDVTYGIPVMRSVVQYAEMNGTKTVTVLAKDAAAAAKLAVARVDEAIAADDMDWLGGDESDCGWESEDSESEVEIDNGSRYSRRHTTNPVADDVTEDTAYDNGSDDPDVVQSITSEGVEAADEDDAEDLIRHFRQQFPA